MDADFYEQVYAIVRLIPKGRVTSYGAIAKSLGISKSSRMVGYAMNHSHGLKPPVPAHRVVNRNGQLTGKFHFSSENKMAELLSKEGIEIKDDKVVNFDKLFWNPLVEIKI